VLGSRRIPGILSNEKERFRLNVSDGKYKHHFTMLATTLNYMYNNNLLTDFTIIRVDKYTTTEIRHKASETKRKVLLLMDLVILNKGENIKKQIGNPILIEENTSTISKSKIQNNNNNSTSINHSCNATASSSNSNVQPSSSKPILTSSLSNNIIHSIQKIYPSIKR